MPLYCLVTLHRMVSSPGQTSFIPTLLISHKLLLYSAYTLLGRPGLCQTTQVHQGHKVLRNGHVTFTLTTRLIGVEAPFLATWWFSRLLFIRQSADEARRFSVHFLFSVSSIHRLQVSGALVGDALCPDRSLRLPTAADTLQSFLDTWGYQEKATLLIHSCKLHRHWKLSIDVSNVNHRQIYLSCWRPQ